MSALTFVPDCFATPKMLEDLDNDVFFNDDTGFHNDDPDNVTLINDNFNVKFFNHSTKNVVFH